MVFKSLIFGRDQVDIAAGAAYDSVMRGALAPHLYTVGLVEDTFDGRFAVTAVHGALVMRRLRALGPSGRKLAEALQRKLFSGFDYALRETGVGDATISRKARALGEQFYGLARALDRALDSDDPALSVRSAIERNGLGGDRPDMLSGYVVIADRKLSSTPDAALLNGDVSWPEGSEVAKNDPTA